VRRGADKIAERRRGAHLYGLKAELIAALLLRLKGYTSLVKGKNYTSHYNTLSREVAIFQALVATLSQQTGWLQAFNANLDGMTTAPGSGNRFGRMLAASARPSASSPRPTGASNAASASMSATLVEGAACEAVARTAILAGKP
jgi:hypothetical protein